MLAIAFAGCGGGGGHDSDQHHDIFTTSLVTSGTLPAGGAAPYSASFRDDDVDLPSFTEDVDLIEVIVTSPVDLSFADKIQVEAKNWFFFQTDFETIARHVGTLPLDTHFVVLSVREDVLDPYIDPVGDLQLKVRIEGPFGPPQVVPVTVELFVRVFEG
jgi:hypothetical protein